MILDCPRHPSEPYKITTAAAWLAYEVESWCTATFTRGLLLRSVPEEFREFVTDLRNRRLSFVSAIAKIEPEKAP